MTHASSTFTIVVGLDLLDGSAHAFGQAARIARAIPGCQIHIVHVSETELDPGACAQLIETLRRFAHDEAASLGGVVAASVDGHVRFGDPVVEIVRLATDVRADMIVIGAQEGPHIKDWLLRSIANRLLISVTCPLLVAGRPPPVRRERKSEAPRASVSPQSSSPRPPA